jgi:serine/threonine transporter sstT
MGMFSSVARRYADGNLMLQILIGIVLGAVIGFYTHSEVAALNEFVKAGGTDAIKLANLKSSADTANSIANSIAILGNLFVGALKAVAPVLVFILVTTSIIVKNFGETKGMGKIVTLYLIGTFLAAVVAVVASFIFPTTLHLTAIDTASMSAPPRPSWSIKGSNF